VWSAFRLPGSAPEAVGVFENQPSPLSANISGVWAGFASFAIVILAMMVGFETSAKREPVFSAYYQLNRGEPKGEASFVTDIFELDGKTSSVAVTTSSQLRNQWIYVNYALINQDTGEAWDFGREISYYYGYDSDGSWSEGKNTDTVVVPSVPPGKYYLRIEPESDATHSAITYRVDVRRDVPVMGFYGLALLALLVPALIVTWRVVGFERARWSESDHPQSPIIQNSSSDGE